MRHRLAAILKEARISQAELGRRIGESKAWVNNRITGYVDIKADELTRFAKALDVSPGTFFEEETPSSTFRRLTPSQVEEEAVHGYHEYRGLNPEAIRELGRSLLRLADDLSDDEELGPERDTHSAA